MYNTTSLLNFALSFSAEVSCSHNDGHLWNSALAKDLRVAKRKEVEDRCCVFLSAGEILVAFLNRNKRPELDSNISTNYLVDVVSLATYETYFVEVDHRSPELVLQLMEIPHSDFSKVSGLDEHTVRLHYRDCKECLIMKK